MIEYNQKENQLSIKIPISGIQELHAYRESILKVLSHIEIDDCSGAFVENLKAVYRLLGHLTADAEYLAEHGDFFSKSKDLSHKHPQGKAGEP